MTPKTIEERLTRLECELRDLKTRTNKLDGISSGDKRRPEWARMDHRTRDPQEEGVAMTDSKLNGINSEDARHTWIIPDNSERDEQIKKRFSTMTYTEIAEDLGLTIGTVTLVLKRLRRLGEIPSKRWHKT